MNRILGVLGLCGLVGCGGSVEQVGTGGGGSGASTSASGTSTGTSSGTGGSCGEFADQPGVGQVAVRFVNQSPQDIFLQVDCSTVRYDLTPASGPDGLAYVYDPSCLQTCEDLQTQPPFACGACPPVLRLVPAGGVSIVTWDGTALENGLAMPAECWAEPGVEFCSRIIAAKGGTYRASAVAWSACMSDPQACSCDDQGNCYGMAGGAQAYSDPIDFDFPAASSVDVVFGPCAFGCPGGGTGG